jgi:hypothetical protein
VDQSNLLNGELTLSFKTRQGFRGSVTTYYCRGCGCNFHQDFTSGNSHVLQCEALKTLVLKEALEAHRRKTSPRAAKKQLRYQKYIASRS